MLDRMVRWLYRASERRDFDPKSLFVRLHWRFLQGLRFLGVTGDVEEQPLTTKELGQYPFASGLWRIVDFDGRQIEAGRWGVKAL